MLLLPPPLGASSSACLPALASFLMRVAGSTLPETVTFPCSASMLVVYTPETQKRPKPGTTKQKESSKEDIIRCLGKKRRKNVAAGSTINFVKQFLDLLLTAITVNVHFENACLRLRNESITKTTTTKASTSISHGGEGKKIRSPEEAKADAYLYLEELDVFFFTHPSHSLLRGTRAECRLRYWRQEEDSKGGKRSRGTTQSSSFYSVKHGGRNHGGREGGQLVRWLAVGLPSMGRMCSTKCRIGTCHCPAHSTASASASVERISSLI
ncbi:hypothetical protein GW17_00021761 [Ensete ventricosum]|nr:hypothetical protein GW17_00021761 [Ensete ventricosum]RZS09172.1 hypothetical protein BHM03_00040240 [Ensete ventricosum]